MQLIPIDHKTYSTEMIYSILVEITTFCNLRCTGCVRTVHNLDNRWANEHLKVSDFERLVESLPPAGEIVTQGVGEPTMHPQLPELIRIAHECGKFPRISFTTNAMVRDEAYYAQLFELGLTHLRISVDSLDPVLANFLREGTHVETLKARIANLAREFPGRIGTRTVVGRQNLPTLWDLLDGINQLGELDVFLHPFDDMGNPAGCLTRRELADIAAQIKDRERDYTNLCIRANNFVPSPDVCIHPWRIPAVTVDGYLTPCCRMTDKTVFTFGNMLESSFRNVWDSESSDEMREEFKRRSPDFCKGCPRYEWRSAP